MPHDDSVSAQLRQPEVDSGATHRCPCECTVALSFWISASTLLARLGSDRGPTVGHAGTGANKTLSTLAVSGSRAMSAVLASTMRATSPGACKTTRNQLR